MRRRPWRRWVGVSLAILFVLLAAAFIVVWSIRVRLATDYIDDEFARRGVQASYDIKRIGFGTQVFENLVIGDPAHPDLTAREVRIQILLGLTGPRVGLITARGVRLFGRVLDDGRVSFGEVDRLLPPPSGLPFRLPDQRVDVADAAIGLVTPAGPVGIGLSGRGNLADGFAGHIAVASRQLALGECTIDQAHGSLAVSVDELRPHFEGPLGLGSLACGNDLRVESPRFALDATLAPALDGWRGETRVEAAAFRAGPQRLAGIEGRFTFRGNVAETRGTVELGSAAAAVDMFRAARTRFAGAYAVSPRTSNLLLNGEVAVNGLTVEGGALGRIAAPLRRLEGTPLGPVGAALAQALSQAGQSGAEARAAVRLANGRGFGAVRLEQLRLDTRSGAQLRAGGGEGITYYWPDGSLRLDGDFALTGGGFPDARFALRQVRAGAPIEGRGRIAPFAAGDARLAFSEISFRGGSGGTSFATAVRLDGPFAGGRVEGLVLPLRGHFGRGRLALGEGCVNAAFRALQVQSLRLGPSRLPLCPIGPALVWQAPGGALRAGAEIRSPRFAGRIGDSPVTFAADRLRADLDGFTAAGVAARLGTPPGVTRLDIAALSGTFTPEGVAGAFSGLSGAIANVPLLISEGTGDWRFAGGALSVDGRLQVADRQDPPRFYPLISDDVRLTLVDNRIHATGWLSHPQTGTRVTQATIDHDLGTGAGAAVLDVPGVTFAADGFQPDALTPLSVGVVALVDGTVTGQGRIEWDAQGSRSTGTFATRDMNLAAPFGPVEGLTTAIHFTDLLGLVSAPGQVAEIDLVRAGVDVYDGTVRYQLQPNYHVAVESGHWPYAGGDLFLEPTMLDFSQESTKYLTFRVVGLDAARFVQQMEFSNIAATGTFDGIIPMQFDISGGRIVDGRLSARPPGGTLSYVGELSDRDLGAYGILAFNALKSLSYDRFDMTLDGDLSGEFVTNIDLDGVARDPALTALPSGGITGMIARRVFQQIARIPFEFNIRIRGPFRALIATARSFDDPTPLIESVLPDVLREGSTTVHDVQDEESEPVQ